MFCAKCGTEIMPGTKFCPYCGELVSEMNEEPMQENKNTSTDRNYRNYRNDTSAFNPQLLRGWFLLVIGSALEIVSLYVPFYTYRNNYDVNRYYSRSLMELYGWVLGGIIIVLILSVVLCFIIRKYSVVILPIVLMIGCYLFFYVVTYMYYNNRASASSRAFPGVAMYMFPIAVVLILIARHWVRTDFPPIKKNHGRNSSASRR